MTTTDKRVYRVTTQIYVTLYTKPRPIVVGVIRGDLLEFREKGRRARFLLPIDVAFRSAIRRHAFVEMAEKRRNR